MDIEHKIELIQVLSNIEVVLDMKNVRDEVPTWLSEKISDLIFSIIEEIKNEKH